VEHSSEVLSKGRINLKHLNIGLIIRSSVLKVSVRIDGGNIAINLKSEMSFMLAQ
jgi:hypothetical protein